MTDTPENVRLSPDGTGVIILDQTQLPGRRVFLTLTTPEEMYEAIRSLRVRGAPAIGVCAGMCLSALAHQRAHLERPAFDTWLREQADYLASSRPTAVNLSWALRRMAALLELPLPLPELLDRLEAEARAIQAEDISMCEKISRYGLSLLHPGDGAHPLQRRPSGYLLLWHRPGPSPSGRPGGIPSQNFCRRDPAPPSGGPAHRL